MPVYQDVMSASDTDATAMLDDAEAAAVNTLVDNLESTPSEFDVCEGSMSGQLYIGVEDGYHRAEVTPTGLKSAFVPEPDLDEEVEPVAHIDPDEGETVEDAVDSITFAGD